MKTLDTRATNDLNRTTRTSETCRTAIVNNISRKRIGWGIKTETSDQVVQLGHTEQLEHLVHTDIEEYAGQI